jgi:serine/threonine protein kinase
MILGQGSYGEVSIRDGKAVKKFAKLPHLIQEYMALKYLSDCEHVVRTNGVNFNRLELYMDLYDGSLRKWLEDKREKKGASDADIMIILRDILLGLVELHDRDLAHGDLKPGNVLIKNQPTRAVLGDCGFVSIAKYAKVDRTAAIYREPVVNHDSSHDMFSFGICFLEMIAEIRLNRQASYDELKQVVQDKVENREYRKIIYNLLHEDKNRRPSARDLLYRLFKINPKRWQRSELIGIQSQSESNRVTTSITQEDRINIRNMMKTTAYKFEINRGKKGYGALLSFIDTYTIDRSLYRIYTAVTLLILSSIFGKTGFREQEVINMCNSRLESSTINEILDKMLSDRKFINILLAS